MIERINEQWSDCERCVLSGTGRRGVVIGSGPAPAALLIVGEAPGEQEDLDGVPFVGVSGKLLRRCASDVGVDLDTDDVYITNLVGCRPPSNRVPMPDEIDACRPRLDAIVAAVKPKAILLLGAVPLMAFTGKKGVARWRGKWQTTTWSWRGNKTDIHTVSTFHPAGLLPGRLKKETDLELFRSDIRSAYDMALGEPETS